MDGNVGGDICSKVSFLQHTLSGRPRLLSPDEPRRVAESVKALKLRYAVITSVDHDDLPDYGAAHWIKTIEEIPWIPTQKIELLIPDFMESWTDR